ncbi:MAG: rhodanese-like domain-containing protein [Desulfuromonadales bacterium]|nr:rhodanese-like domain-containing protein [Desulfuromonadales bacterium]
MFSDLKRIGLEACVLLAFGVLIGLSLNHKLLLDAFSGHLVSQPRQTAQESVPIALPMPALIDDVQQVAATGGLIVDARNPELYAAGHIDGAVSLPLVEIDAALPDFVARIDKDRTLVIYCSGFGCPDSFDLAVLLIESGYKDVRVFEGGFPEWRDAGLPVAGDVQ